MLVAELKLDDIDDVLWDLYKMIAATRLPDIVEEVSRSQRSALASIPPERLVLPSRHSVTKAGQQLPPPGYERLIGLLRHRPGELTLVDAAAAARRAGSGESGS